MRYRKKPVVIDAIQWTGDNYPEVFEFTEGNAYPTKSHSDTLAVSTLEGEVKAETEIVEADELDMTDDRGGGFGHTNK